ncbi:hypothetical protein ACJ41O_008407 [Fusarium nematophilum]
MTTVTPTPGDASPLSLMDNLSPAVAYLSPDKVAASAPPGGGAAALREPRLIVMLAWMDARDAHIAKYIAQHRVLFPTSPILLLRSTLQMYVRPSLRRRLFEPALPVLRATAGDGASDDEPSFLLHVFSNGGVSSAVTLWNLWEGDGRSVVPRHAVIMDSCPGFFHWKRNHHVLARPLPPWASPLVWVLLAVAWAVYIPWGRIEPQEANASALNTAGRIARETKRAYLYGDADRSVGWEDVEMHGRQARDRGGVVRLERFEGGEHVSHVRVDGERYWRVVKETWEGKGE